MPEVDLKFAYHGFNREDGQHGLHSQIQPGCFTILSGFEEASIFLFQFFSSRLFQILLQILCHLIFYQ